MAHNQSQQAITIPPKEHIVDLMENLPSKFLMEKPGNQKLSFEEFLSHMTQRS
ncbi:MAG: hypothetical protein OXC40_06930 [Proteobacteria bacterium]|nr:hypothetical protein [Pseudomonadota bacterium]